MSTVLIHKKLYRFLTDVLKRINMELWVGQLLAGIILFVLTFIFTVIIPPLIIRQQKKTSMQGCDRDCEGLVIDNPGYQQDHKELGESDEERLLGENEDLNNSPDVGVNENTSLLNVSALKLNKLIC